MGLTRSSLRFLTWQHKKKPFSGRILTLGRLGVHARFSEMISILESEGLQPFPVSESEKYTNIPAWKSGPFGNFTCDRAFFRALANCEVETMDVSAYENPEHVWDLNQPIPDSLVGQFDLVIDGGTMEHVFDVRQTLRNISKLLKVGGRVIHCSPATNWGEHGFYQFSPTLFYDYYSANGFQGHDCFIVDQRGYDVTKQAWDFYKWNLNRGYCNMVSSSMLAILFTAEKTNRSTDEKIPQQGCFQGHADGGKTGKPQDVVNVKPSGLLSLVKRLIPRFVKTFIWRYILKRDPARKPWNLEYIGRF